MENSEVEVIFRSGFSMSWGRYEALIRCHRCHKALGEEFHNEGRVSYHPKCVPPDIFKRLVRTTPHNSSVPLLSTEDCAAREAIKSGVVSYSYKFKFPMVFRPAYAFTLRLP